jgi:hypothetical protein
MPLLNASDSGEVTGICRTIFHPLGLVGRVPTQAKNGLEDDWIRAKAPTDSELVFGLKRTKDAGKEGASDDDYRM